MQPWKPKPGIEAQTPVNRAHMAAFAARPAHQWGSSYAPRTPMRPPTAAELAAGKAWAPQLADFVIPGVAGPGYGLSSFPQTQGPSAYQQAAPQQNFYQQMQAAVQNAAPGIGKSYIPPPVAPRGGFGLLGSMSPYSGKSYSPPLVGPRGGTGTVMDSSIQYMPPQSPSLSTPEVKPQTYPTGKRY
jgi:hypothetical protein